MELISAWGSIWGGVAPNEPGLDWYRLAEFGLMFLAILGGVVGVLYQVNKGIKNTLETQRENHRQEYLTDAYRQITKQLLLAEDASIEASNFVRLAISQLTTRKQYADDGMPSDITVEHRYPEFLDLHSKFSNGVAELVWWLETNQVISNSVHVFILAFNSALHEIQIANRDLQKILLSSLPINDPNGPLVYQDEPLSLEHLAELRAVADEYERTLGTVSCYMTDLKIQMQNETLGNVFENRAKVRVPIEPMAVVSVLNDEDATRLTNYFENETSWGKYQKELHKEVESRVAQGERFN